mmetsp:Transcript_7149/g.14704  ORF Transcript_7149/g.14704 Transcript_7149/m.14704 type:complete len:91 (-) Transcript_7149:582-854(-)
MGPETVILFLQTVEQDIACGKEALSFCKRGDLCRDSMLRSTLPRLDSGPGSAKVSRTLVLAETSELEDSKTCEIPPRLLVVSPSRLFRFA